MTTKVDSQKFYGIKEASVVLEVSEMYIRKMVRFDKIPSKLVSVNNTKVTKHLILGADLIAWRAKSVSRTSREDGRNKFTAYLSSSELAKVAEFCRANKIPEPILTNKGQYEKRAAQKAQKALDIAALKNS